MHKLLLSGLLCLTGNLLQAQTVADFESLPLSGPDTFYVNHSASGTDVGFSDGLAYFPCVYSNTQWGWFWDGGFAYSNVKDSTTPGYLNMYAARPGEGYGGSDNYLVGWGTDFRILLDAGAQGRPVSGFYVANSTYAYLSMRDGDDFLKGGFQAEKKDWFRLIVRAYYQGVLKQDSVTYYLADFRDADPSKNFIKDGWEWLDLRSLGLADSLDIRLAASRGEVPFYFCLDNLETAETANVCTAAPAALQLLTSDTAVCAGGALQLEASDPNAAGGIAGYAYVWEHASAAGGPWTAATEGTGVYSLEYRTAPVTERLWYRASVYCEATGDTVHAAAMELDVLQLPLPELEQHGLTLSVQDFFAGYQWYRNGEPVTGAESYSYEVTSSGEYHVVVTNEAGCDGVSATSFIDEEAVSVAGLQKAGGVKVYPNPFSDRIVVEAGVPVRSLQLLGVDGRMVAAVYGGTELRITALPAGVYLLQVHTEEGTVITKRIQKH